MNNSVVADAINYIYEQKISELRIHFQIDIEKFNNKLITKEYFDYVFEIYNKKINDINIERISFLEKFNQKIHIQEMNSFLSIGERMKDLKSQNKQYYNYIVDKAFAINTPLSMFKFKYAGGY
jgi:hypothetical protein